jgi:hypothetical protein
MTRHHDEEQGNERHFPDIDPADFPEPPIADPEIPGKHQGPEKTEPEPDEED